MSRKAGYIGAMILVAAFAGVFFVLRAPDKSVSEETEFRLAYDFILKDYEGREVKLSDFSEKGVLINSWATWCPFCKKELLDFVTLKKDFGDAVIIAINRAETLEIVKKYSDELGVTNDLIFLLDPFDSFYQSIGGFSMPETIFVDKEGFVKYHKRGPMELEEMKRRVEDAFGL